MASTLKVDTITTPDGTGNITTERPLSGSGASLTNLNATNLASGTVPTARLGSGTANSTTFLRGDQTYAEAGGGAWNVISSTAISSGTSSLDITSGFTATYEHYVIQLTNLTNSTNSTVNMRIAHGSASFQTGSNYRGHISEARSNSGSYSTTFHNGSNLIEFMYNSAHLSATVHISNPADTSLPKHMYWDGSAENGSGDMGAVKGWSFYDATDAVTGIQWWPTSGTFDDGRVTLYGISHI